MIIPRIYIVIATFIPSVGGAEKQAFAQSRSLLKRGYETTVITFRHDKAWPRREAIEGVPVIRVAGRLLIDRWKLPRLLQKMAYLAAVLVMGWTLWRYRKRYDVLHVYGLSLLALLAALVCRLTGKRLIVAIRSADSGRFTESHDGASLIAGPLDATTPWLLVDERLRANGRVHVSSDLEGLERMGKPIVHLTRLLLHSTRAVVVVLSSRMKVSLADHNFILPGVRIRLIPNGVDISHFIPTPDDPSRDERAQVVVCISGMRYEKGIDVLLQAWYLVQQQAPQARLIIVGRGSLQPQLERMAETLGIADSVEFTGMQSDVLAQLYRGDLAVLPSRWEGMPNAVLEAMACGLPCVATRVSGSEDIIEHGVDGLLVEPEDYQDMAQALLTLLCDPLLIQKYGRAARETIERRYSLEQIMDRYVELYQNMAGDPCQDAEDTPRSEIGQRSS
ncbi:MAG TPA: glycosyltransferase family 4 protein [Ktedonobacteraceae bacterium]|nr:glycosyltransferase family 4 protein [Ktedonobacteraceae bacterium]